MTALGFFKPEPALEFVKAMVGKGYKVLALVDVDLDGVSKERVDRFLYELENLGVEFGRVTGHSKEYLESWGHKCGRFVVEKPYSLKALASFVDALLK